MKSLLLALSFVAVSLLAVSLLPGAVTSCYKPTDESTTAEASNTSSAVGKTLSAKTAPKEESKTADETTATKETDTTKAKAVAKNNGKGAENPEPTKAGSILRNGGFEDGTDARARDWSVRGTSPPRRSKAEAKSGSSSMHVLLENKGAKPSEGHLVYIVREGIVGGGTYELSFWFKGINYGASYVQQYEVKWFGSGGEAGGGRPLTDFRGAPGAWEEVKVPGLTASQGAIGAELFFRFVTGAINGGSGEVFIDDVALTPTGDTATRVETVVTTGAKVESDVKESKTEVATTDKPVTASLNDPTWSRVTKALDDGIAKVEGESLDQLLEDINVLRKKSSRPPGFEEAMALVLIYYDSPAREDPFEERAGEWVAKYPESRWSRDVHLDLVNIKVDRKDVGAAPLIETFLKRFPSDPEAAKLRALPK